MRGGTARLAHSLAHALLHSRLPTGEHCSWDNGFPLRAPPHLLLHPSNALQHTTVLSLAGPTQRATQFSVAERPKTSHLIRRNPHMFQMYCLQWGIWLLHFRVIQKVPLKSAVWPGRGGCETPLGCVWDNYFT